VTPTENSVLDGHDDALLRLWSDEDDPVAAFRDSRDGRDGGHVDLPRAREGGLAAGLFAAFAPSGERLEPTGTDEGYAYPYPDPPDTDHARRVTYEQLALLHRLDREVEGFRLVTDPGGLERCLDGEASATSRASSGRSSDGGEAVGAVPHLEGAAAVASDLANLDLLYAAGVGDVTACSSDPLVVSHAGAHAVCPASRNLTDEQLELVGRSDGVVGVTFASGFLRPDGDREADASIETLVDHVVHVADVAGPESVALGSDFDGASIPEEVGDVAGLPACSTPSASGSPSARHGLSPRATGGASSARPGPERAQSDTRSAPQSGQR
jgi:membrane dipeptidase